MHKYRVIDPFNSQAYLFDDKEKAKAFVKNSNNPGVWRAQESKTIYVWSNI